MAEDTPDTNDPDVPEPAPTDEQIESDDPAEVDEPDDDLVADTGIRSRRADERNARLVAFVQSLAAEAGAEVVNRSIIGELVVHYPARDVAFVLDGDAAMRLMTMFSQSGQAQLADVLDVTSDARSMWFSVDIDTPMAMSWTPGAPKRNRVTVDPRPASR